MPKKHKNFILDTNVLLHDPRAIFGFADNTVCIPIVVIEEVDGFKKHPTELGRSAREVAGLIDGLRKNGSLVEGVPLKSGGRLRVIVSDRDLPRGHRIAHQADNFIIATALTVKENEPESPAIFVTLDTNLRIRANALGLHAEDYDTERITIDELYPGTAEVELPAGSISKLFEEGSLPLPPAPARYGQWFDNGYASVRDGRSSALTRVDAGAGTLVLISNLKEPIWGIRPRNREQHFALDACLRDDIKLVTLVGKAGTGKTLIAIAAGLHAVTDSETFQRLLVSRPIMPLGRDIGFLPGEVDKKLRPWMQPIHDNVEFLLGLRAKGDKRPGRGADDLIRKGVMEIEPLTYIRGRSIPQQYMIVDEAQNLTPHEVKTILTRAGDDTKVVLTGDPYQIDNPYVDSVSNGLTYLVERFKGVKLAATVTLEKGERSELAELAANLL